MAKLIVKRETKMVTLDYIEGCEVEVYTSITGGDIDKMQKEGLLNKEMKEPLKPLLYLIKGWNLESDDGKPLPVSVENISKFDFRDLMKIYKEAGFDEENSSFLGKTVPKQGG